MTIGFRGPLFILLSCSLASITGTLEQVAPEGATPVMLTEVRMGLGALCLLAWCLALRRLPPALSSIPKLPALGMIAMVVLYQLFFFTAVKEVGVAVGTVVSISTTPVWAAAVAYLFTRKKPSRAWYPATFMAVAGVVLLNWGELTPESLAGLSLPVAAGLCYAFEINFVKRLAPLMAPEAIMLLETGGAALVLLPFACFFPAAWILTPQGLAVSAALGVFTAALAYAFFTVGLQTVSAPAASTLALSEPFIAACLGIFFLGEPMTPFTGIGLALMFLAVVILIPGEGRN